MRSRSPRFIALAAVGTIVFLAISFELARYFTGTSAERSAVYNLLVDEAKGDGNAVIGRLSGCAKDPACVTQTRATVAKLKTTGKPKILIYESPTGHTLSHATGRARVAWEIVSENKLPVVQCVTLTRRWSFASGSSVSLLRLSAPIDNESGC